MTYYYTSNQWGDRYIEEINRQDFSSIPASNLLSEALNTDFTKENTLYIIVGSDSGLLIPYISSIEIGRGSRFALVEPDDIYAVVHNEYKTFLHSLPKTGSTKHTQISLHSTSNWQEEVLNDSSRSWLLGGELEIAHSYASLTDYAQCYLPLYKEISTICEDRIMALNKKSNAKIFIEKQIENAADNTTLLQPDNNFGKHKTAIVLGGGPSLDTHLDWIIEHRDQLFVIAVSRISNKLRELAFTPDMVVSVDPFDFSYELCKSGILWTDVPLVNNFHVAPQLLQQWQGPTFCLGITLPWHIGKRSPEFDFVKEVGPTVSHAAVFVAYRLGFSKILMTGVELCFNTSLSTHAHASPESLIQRMPSICDAQVETYSGRIAGTRSVMLHSVRALEVLGSVINKDAKILFNLSDQAAKCPSIDYIDVTEVVLPTQKPDFSSYTKIHKPPPSLGRLTSLSKDIKVAKLAFSKMRSQCRKATECIEKMYGKKVDKRAHVYSNRLNKIEKILEKDFSEYFGATKHYYNLEFSYLDRPIDFSDMSDSELYEWGNSYYNLISSSAKFMIKNIDILQKRIDLRIQELLPEAQLEELVNRWREDKTLGRVLSWKGQESLQGSSIEQLKEFREEATTNLTQTTALVEDKLREKNENISNSLKSLLFLSNVGRLDELQLINDNLQDMDWPYSALQSFTAGLIAQLEEKTLEATVEFQNTIELCSEQLETSKGSLGSMQRLIVESLVNMTKNFMKAQDQESTLSTLSTLCEIQPQYIPSFGKALSLCGQSEFAIELLDNYTELYPENKNALFILNTIKSQHDDASNELRPKNAA